MKIYETKTGRYVTFEKVGVFWRVAVKTASGELIDKISCDDYRDAIAYRKAFLRIARAG